MTKPWASKKKQSIFNPSKNPEEPLLFTVFCKSYGWMGDVETGSKRQF